MIHSLTVRIDKVDGVYEARFLELPLAAVRHESDIVAWSQLLISLGDQLKSHMSQIESMKGSGENPNP